jgi:hypothetical protein
MHKICFTISLFHASTCFEHHVLIVRRSQLYCTASGTIKLKQVSGLKLLNVTKITKIYKYEHVVVNFFGQQIIKKK